MEVNQDLTGATVTFYPYRTVWLKGPRTPAPRIAFREFEDALAAKAGVQAENHVVYKITRQGEDPVYVGIGDSRIYFGSAIEDEK